MTDVSRSEQPITAALPTRRGLSSILGGSGALIALIILIVALWIVSPPFRSPTSLLLIGLEASFIGIVAAGQTFVILTSGIDLSVEAIVGFSSVVAAILISGSNTTGGQVSAGLPSYLAIPIALAVGTGVGLLEGVLITGLNINPFIVSLGFLSALGGISLVWTQGSSIYIAKDDLTNLLSDFITLGTIKIPIPLIIALIFYFSLWVILRHTKLGRYIYAIGGNETAARLSGINVNRVKIIVYGISGFMASVTGMLLLSRLQGGSANNGVGYTLTSVAAVVIGGTALAGGSGGLWGTLIGAILIQVVQAGLVYISFPSNAKQIVIGVIIVLAVALDVIRRGEVKWLNRLFRRRVS